MMKAASMESFLELQKFTKFCASNRFLPVLLVFGVLFVLLPTLFRDSSLMIGDESFYHIRIARDIIDDWTIKYDELSFSGRNNFMELGTGYAIFIASFLSGLSVENSARLLFMLLGLGSLLFGYLILRHFNTKEGMLSLLFIAISPAFIYLFSIVNRFAFPIFLTILFSYLFFKKRYFLSFLSFILIPLFNQAYAVFLLITFLILFLYFRNKLILLIFLIILYGWIFTLGKTNFSLISDFGADIGVSIFGIFVILLGVNLLWREKGFVQLYASSILLFIAAIKFNWLIFVLTAPFCLLLTFNLTRMIDQKWGSNLIKDLTFLLLICGLLFSGVSFAKSLSEKEPNTEFFYALKSLPYGSVVLSHSSNGYWINYAGMKNVVDSFIGPARFNERNDDLNLLFGTRDLSIATEILDKYNVDYILITPNMKQGLVWDDEEGLLFLLKYSERFSKVYDGKIEMWEYKK